LVEYVNTAFAEMMKDKTSARLIRPHVSRESAFQAFMEVDPKDVGTSMG
jgi:hypothetical protein